MIAWLIRLFGGFAIWKDAQLGKIIYIGIILVVAFTIYTKAFIEPKFKTVNQTVNKIETVEKIEYHQETIIQAPKEKAFLGIKLFGFKLGASL
jgi:hypothetical protein